MSEDRRPSWTGVLLIASVLASVLLTVAAGQQSPAERVVIKRVPLQLRDPETFQVGLQLKPLKSIPLVARTDGVIDSVSVEVGEELSVQEEVGQLRSGIRQIELERAQAAFQVARLEHEASGEGASRELSAARLAVATVDLRLAEQRLDDLTVRAPFAGTITGVHVTEGQFVRAGDPLATLADLTRLTVGIPVSGHDVRVGDPIEIRVEDTTIPGEVLRMSPLAAEFDPLRDLFLAVATATVIVEGTALSPGQAVYSDMIPRHPVAEIPTAALLNTDDGQRRVQVIREELVQDVVVQLLGQNGEDQIFVSGRFQPGDELVVETSHDLLEGMRIVPSTAGQPEQAGARLPPRFEDDD